MDPLHSPRVLLFVAAAGLLLRLAVPAVRGIDAHQDGGYVFYVEMAENVLAGEGLHRSLPFGQGERHAIRTPLYPLLLAGLKLLPGAFPWQVALAGAFCGAATVLCAGLAARRLFGPRAGLAAAVAVAIWPHAVVHDTALQDTALYSALFALLMLLQLRRLAPRDDERPGMALAASAGLVAALAVLTRVALLPTAIALLAWPALVSDRRARALRLSVLSLALLGAGLAPWLVRNARVVGAPVLTSDTGRSLWLGNNPQTFSVYPGQSIDRAEERAWAALPEATRAESRALAGDELASDAWFRARALAHLRADPGGALLGGLAKAWAAFSPRLSPRAALPKQLVHAVSWTPAALLFFVSAWRHRRRWRELAPVWLALLLFALQCAVFFGHSAYRLYLDPWVLVVASGLLVAPGREAP